MTMDHRLDRLLTRFPALATVAYLALVVGLICAAWFAAADLLDRRQAVADAETLLAQLERGRATVAAPSATSEAPQGSPFIEGQTVTLAGAALLQRVAGVVTGVGGNVLSSQVDVQDAASKGGFVSLVASCEVTQPDLQKLLYDLEAGMPYLFVDQLVVEAPDNVTRGEGGRLRVMIGVSGQWRGSK
ncbi:MAG TPA: type II secretion system protein GspM [Xanthobacteraceae bacterium]|nr:type II secretion system protein GspM [Xanthobacteraceae bacterium]